MTKVLTWTGANGTATVLDGSAGIRALHAPIGLESASPQNTIDDYVAFDGAVLTNRRRSTRSVAVKLHLTHATRVETVVAQVAAMFQGPGTLQWADGVNTRTLKQVVYEAGIDGSGDVTPTMRVVVVSLIALDPWWYGPTESQGLSSGTSTTFDASIAFDAFMPFDGGGSGSSVVTGDTGAYPVVTVTGPATTLTVGAGGLFWSIASPLLAGDVLVVDHRPGSRGPVLNGGVVDWSLLSEASRLWLLPQGTVSVISGTTGSSGSTSITLTWQTRWLTP